MSNYKYLDKVNFPSDIKKLSIEELKILSEEIRKEMIEAVSVTGGHLGAGLGVVELTVALHYIFDTPNDKLIWDVGHQSYPHKIITGRKDKIRTLRQGKGLSGFTIRSGLLRVTCTARLKLLLPITDAEGIESILNPSLVIKTSLIDSRFGIQEITKSSSICDGTSFKL